jgi:spore maturation protein CgeB
MRWAIIGELGNDSFEFHWKDALLHLGHDVRVFDLTFGFYHPRKAHYWLRQMSASYDKAKAKNLANAILKFEPDIVLAVYRNIHPDTIEIIKRSNSIIKVIHVNQDNLCTLQQQQVLASAYDAFFVKDPFMVRTFRDKAGLNVHYLPESFNPRFHAPPNCNRKELEKETDIDVLIYGTFYPYRNRFVEKILRRGRKIKLFGVAGPFISKEISALFANKVIMSHEKSHYIFGSKIVLNNFFYGEIEGVNCKYFEINGSGGFQLCDYKDALKEYSPLEPSRYTFNSIAEANELIEYYLPRQEERHAIADAQRLYFLDHHTYEHRISAILKVIGE